MQSIAHSTRKITLAVLGIFLLLGATGILSAWQLSAALAHQAQAAALLRNHMEADMMHDAVRSDVLAALASTDPAMDLKYQDARKDLAEHLEQLRKAIGVDSAYRGNAAVEAATARIAGPMKAYADGASRIVEMAPADPAGARRMLPAFFDLFHTLEESMSAASDAIEAHSDATARYGKWLGIIAIALLVVTLAAAIAGGMGIARLVRARLVDPMVALAEAVQNLSAGTDGTLPETDRPDELGELARAIAHFNHQVQIAEGEKQATTALIVETVGTGLQRLAKGDLTARVDAELTGPFARLKRDFNAAVDSLRGLIGTVHTGAGHLRRASREISDAANDLARRTEATAASLVATTQTVGEIDSRLKSSVQAATATVERADHTIHAVQSGRSRVTNAVSAMGRVSDSAKGIDAVIEGLDKIAFQTRVLAMNAAVEAGRAGEAGRGFAVVADLVSALAMRAEEEAGRARDQLTVTQVEIGTAVSAVQDVDGAFAEISENAATVHQLLSQVASDNRVQSQAISQLGETIRTMDQSTQQNAAMVEETSASARSLLQEVTQLADAADQFEIGSKPHVSASAPAPRRQAEATGVSMH